MTETEEPTTADEEVESQAMAPETNQAAETNEDAESEAVVEDPFRHIEAYMMIVPH